MKRAFFLTLLFSYMPLFFLSCKPRPATEDASALSGPKILKIYYHCPRGWQGEHRVCIKKNGLGRLALGDFPDLLKERCLKLTEDDKNRCNDKFMDHDVLNKIRGDGFCPIGTHETNSHLCQGTSETDKNYVFGPFPQIYVMRCMHMYKDAKFCTSQKWTIADMQKVMFAKTGSGSKPAQASADDLGKTPNTQNLVKQTIEQKYLKGKTYCERDWDVNAPYADYTTYDPKNSSDGVPRGRTIAETLQQRMESVAHPFLNPFDISAPSNSTDEDICHNARIMEPCFAASLKDDATTIGGKKLAQWAAARGLNPKFIKMAISAQETNLGWWTNQGDNGVGIMQLALPIKLDSLNSGYVPLDDDETWRGITYNTLTNIRYGTHMLAAKIHLGAESLYELARTYNGSPHQERYANNVVAYYEVLKNCKSQ